MTNFASSFFSALNSALALSRHRDAHVALDGAGPVAIAALSRIAQVLAQTDDACLIFSKWSFRI
ncbi:MAG: hypothetical protein ACREUI_08135 [Burkholderiales bacterium]